ncbi:MAG: alpha-amylase, partial [Phycisphaerales bacterium]|nr:alpha-amylase [Phycisphaerales bacterium]
MATICLQLSLHQPHVLRRYSVFDQGEHYFDTFRTREACRRFAERSVLPTNRLLLALMRRHEGAFRISLNVSGTALDLFAKHVPAVIETLHAMADTGCVEFVATPYDKSLAVLYSRGAFVEQVELHRARIRSEFQVTPSVFCNTHMIYGNVLADAIAPLAFDGVVCDGDFDTLAGRSCNRVYLGGRAGVPLLLRNEQLSRDVSERFADRGWDQWPLTAPKFAERLARFDGDAEVVTLVWDYATFGVRIPADAGILDFLRHLPDRVLAYEHLRFATASEAIAAHAPVDTYHPAHFVSRAEHDSKLAAWLGNPMQSHAAHEFYAMEPAIRSAGNPGLLEDWRRLQAVDYLRAMTTADTGLASPPAGSAESPYDSYINFMNVCDNITQRCGLPITA